MNTASLTSKQRRIIMAMAMAVIVVLAMLAGFVVTSLRGLESLPSATVPPLTPLPPPLPTPSPSPAPAPTSEFEAGIWSQVQAARLFDQIARQVETLRGLSPRAEVPLSFLDEREMGTLLHQFYTDRSLETPLLPYTELGLLPTVPITIHSHQAASIYVAGQEQLYVVTGRQENSVDDQALLAHAYIHALQDQQFDLNALDARVTTTDAALAVRALVEGDATLTTALYRYGDLATADWGHLSDLILQAEQPGYGEKLDAIAAWKRLQRFPYWEGRHFVDVLLRAGGWEAVNRAYTTPPRSTEQVLHPERYMEEGSEPAHVVVPELRAVLDEDWSPLVQNTLGEFVTGLYLDTLLPEESAWSAADGWGGDMFVVWGRTGGGRLVVWRTLWDNAAEAAEFERALVALVPERYLPAWPVDPPRGLSGQWWEVNAGAVCVSRAARYVTFVYAPDADVLTDVAEALP